jgi:PKD repeat protein
MKFYLPLLSIVLFFTTIPVLAQTTITLRPGPDDGKDAAINSIFRDNNYWYHPDFLASSWTVQGEPFTHRSLIAFDLSGIPEGSVILDAKLSLYANPNTPQSHNHSQLSGSNEAFLERVVEPWNDLTVTWNNQPNTSSENQVWLHPSNYELEDYTDIDVTGLMNDIFHDPESNFGMMISLKTEVYYRSLVFASSNHENPEKRPKLVILYDECPLPDAHFAYEQQGHMVQFSHNDTTSSSCLWDFGDGYLSSLPNPTYTYEEMGEYLVCLTLENECGTSQWCDTIDVCQQSVSLFTYEIQGRTVFFTNLSENADAFWWDMGTGFFTATESPTYTYEENGDFLVCLDAGNTCSEHTYCDTISIKVFEGLGEIDGKHSIDIFPNPSSGIITIVASADGKRPDYKVAITNCMSQVVFESHVNEAQFKVNTESFGSSGLYFIQVFDKNSTLVDTRKIILQ